MKVSQLYTYPIKSLRETPLTEAEVSKHGFLYDRRFMILKVHQTDPISVSSRRYGNMHVAYFPEMALFQTNMTFPKDENDRGSIKVTYTAPETKESRSLDVPLRPDTTGLDVIHITMHSSPTKGYDMGRTCNDWFSNCFGYDVILAYLGENLRSVLMSKPTNGTTNNSWLSGITSNIPLLGQSRQEDKITFADCAPYLIVSETSLVDVSARLPDGEEMDMTKFRPNIVIQGAETAYEEDFWAEITIGEARFVFWHNCVRCKSINVDYATGQPGKGEAGAIFKKLQKDRRVDKGGKYMPVFGRYGFLDARDDGKRVAVGDEVTVVKKNSERTTFDWPGLMN